MLDRTVSIHDQAWKGEQRRWVMLTAYDFPTAQILDRAGVPALLVGDSLGRNVLGTPTSSRSRWRICSTT